VARTGPKAGAQPSRAQILGAREFSKPSPVHGGEKRIQPGSGLVHPTYVSEAALTTANRVLRLSCHATPTKDAATLSIMKNAKPHVQNIFLRAAREETASMRHMALRLGIIALAITVRCHAARRIPLQG